jgi:hypothetical protein
MLRCTQDIDVFHRQTPKIWLQSRDPKLNMLGLPWGAGSTYGSQTNTLPGVVPAKAALGRGVAENGL